jgi:hypothetical protein
VRWVRTIFALLLLAAWPAVTSHSLLEQFGFIHEVHEDHHHSDGGSHEHNSDNHDFADGDYVAKLDGGTGPLWVDIQLYEVPWLAVAFASIISVSDVNALGPAPPGVAPPEFLRSWNFLHRTAVDARAPSFIS